MKKRKFGAVSIIITLIVLAVAIFLGISIFSNSTNPDEPPTEKEIARVLEAASAHIDIPEGEPIVGRIRNAEALIAEQAFYQGAKDGDYLIIFPSSAKAVVYSLDDDILVNVGPIIFQREGEPTELFLDDPITVEVRNGGEVAGAAGDLADKLSPQAFDVVAISNAANTDYDQTTLVVLDENVPVEVVTELANQLSATVAAEVPLDEEGSDAQILIIVGAGGAFPDQSTDTTTEEETTAAEETTTE